MLETYEVFADVGASQALIHVGSVRAHSEKLAVQAAREIYFRRSTCTKLEVVKGTSTFASPAPEAELTRRNFERTYRTPAFLVRKRY